MDAHGSKIREQDKDHPVAQRPCVQRTEVGEKGAVGEPSVVAQARSLVALERLSSERRGPVRPFPSLGRGGRYRPEVR